MAGSVARRLQEVQDLAGLDVEVAGELLDFDSAGLGGGDISSFLSIQQGIITGARTSRTQTSIPSRSRCQSSDVIETESARSTA